MTDPKDRKKPDRADDEPNDEEEGDDDVGETELWERLRASLHELEDLEDAESDEEDEDDEIEDTVTEAPDPRETGPDPEHGEGEPVVEERPTEEPEDDSRIPAEEALDDESDEEDTRRPPTPPVLSAEELADIMRREAELWSPVSDRGLPDVETPTGVDGAAPSQPWAPVGDSAAEEIPLPSEVVVSSDDRWGPLGPEEEAVPPPLAAIPRAVAEPSEAPAAFDAGFGPARLLPWRGRLEFRQPALGPWDYIADPTATGTTLEVPIWAWEDGWLRIGRPGGANWRAEPLPGDSPAFAARLGLRGREFVVRVVLVIGSPPLLRLGRDALAWRFVVDSAGSDRWDPEEE